MKRAAWIAVSVVAVIVGLGVLRTRLAERPGKGSDARAVLTVGFLPVT